MLDLLNLLPAAKVMLIRICYNKKIVITNLSPSIHQLIDLGFAEIDKTTDVILLRPTTSGVCFVFKRMFLREKKKNDKFAFEIEYDNSIN